MAPPVHPTDKDRFRPWNGYKRRRDIRSRLKNVLRDNLMGKAASPQSCRALLARALNDNAASVMLAMRPQWPRGGNEQKSGAGETAQGRYGVRPDGVRVLHAGAVPDHGQ